MKVNPNNLSFADFVSTGEERDRLVVALEAVSQKLYSGRELDKSAELSGLVGSWEAEVMERLLRRAGTDLSQRDQVSALLGHWQEELGKLPEIRITLAFRPSAREQGELAKKAQETIAEPAIAVFETDSSLLGGATVSFRGIYADWSLRRLLRDKLPSLEPKLLALF